MEDIAFPRASNRHLRLLYVDALRGIAAISVVYFHYTSYVLESTSKFNGWELLSAVAFCQVLDMGKFGVVLFFLISGFVIPESFGASIKGQNRRFVVSRFFRLYPLYWLVLFAGVFLTWPDLGQTFSRITILANLTMIQNLLGHENVVGVFWTLQIELIFYACCVALAFAGHLRSPRTLAYTSLASLTLAAAIAIVRYEIARKLPLALPLGLCIMFFGALWRHGILVDPAWRRRAGIVAAVIVFMLPPLCLIAYNRDFGFHEVWYRYVISYDVAIAVFLVGTTKVRIEASMIVFLGQVSYSVYLLHPLVASFAWRLGFRPESVSLDANLYNLALGGVVVALSWITFCTIERPAIALGRKFRSAPSRELIASVPPVEPGARPRAARRILDTQGRAQN